MLERGAWQAWRLGVGPVKEVGDDDSMGSTVPPSNDTGPLAHTPVTA